MAEPAASEVYKRLHHTTTPSPNSRLSSGFGSLQDEDGSLFESSYSQQGVAKVQAPMQDVRLQGSEASQRASPQKHADEAQMTVFRSHHQQQRPPQHGKHHVQRQPSTRDTSPASHGNKTATVSQPIGPATTSVQQGARVFSLPNSPPKVGHTSSQGSPQKRKKQVTSPTSPFSGLSSPISAQERHAVSEQQLEAKRVEIRESEGEKQKLKCEVQLLGLKVQEEEIR